MKMENNVVRQEEQGEPLVSVLVPSYNHQKYVVECLESIKELNYRRLELIVSDDCSLDSTFALTEKWVEKNAARFERTLVVRQERNVGLIRNLQFLFDCAQGDYLAYIASDDLFVESSITDRLSLLLEDDHLDAVIGNSQLISESGTVLQERRTPDHISNNLHHKELAPSVLIRYWNLMCSAAIIRKKALLENGSVGRLPEDLKIEDRYLFIRLAAQGKLSYVDSIIAKYRHTGGSLSRAPELRRYGTIGFMECDIKNRHLVKGFDRALLDLKIASCNAVLNRGNRIPYYLKQGSIKIAAGMVWTLFRFSQIILQKSQYTNDRRLF